MAEFYPDQPVRVDQLAQEITSLALPNFRGVRRNGRAAVTQRIVIEVDPLTAGQKTSLDAVVAAHVPIAPDSPGAARGASVSETAPQAVANATDVVLTFTTEAYNDQGLLHNNITNPSRLTVRSDGRYHLLGAVPWAGAAVGFRRADLLLNGITSLTRVQAAPGSADPVNQQIACYAELVATDIVEVRVHQTSGGPLSVLRGAAFQIQRVS